MSSKAKKLSIYFAESSLNFINIFSSAFAPIESEDMIPISSATNLCVQATKLLIETEKLPLTHAELMYCCDVMNGCVQLIDATLPSDVSIQRAIESMNFNIVDSFSCSEWSEKWGVSYDSMAPKIREMTLTQFFVLAIAIKQFWTTAKVDGFKRSSDCSGYQEWSAQWLQPETKAADVKATGDEATDALLAEHHRLLQEQDRIKKSLAEKKASILAINPDFDFEMWELGNTFPE